MPLIQFVVDKGSTGGDAYATAPDIDLTAGTIGSNTTGPANHSFRPDYYLVRSDASNANEVILSFDGKNDSMQLPLVANNGGFYVQVHTHSAQVWVKRVGSAAASRLLITAATNA